MKRNRPAVPLRKDFGKRILLQQAYDFDAAFSDTCYLHASGKVHFLGENRRKKGNKCFSSLSGKE